MIRSRLIIINTVLHLKSVFVYVISLKLRETLKRYIDDLLSDKWALIIKSKLR